MAKRLPKALKAEQQLLVLRDAKDNRVAASLVAALSLGARREVRMALARLAKMTVPAM